ncbi:hypothetical protein BH11ARM2_BH11ARM2_28650 [soil metagenome]
MVAEAAKLLHQGRRTRALDYLDAARKLAPNDGQVLGLRGVTLARMGRTEEAKRDLSRAAELRPDDPRAWANLATFLAETGQPDEARPAAARALELDPNDVGAKAVIDRMEHGGPTSTRLHMVSFIAGRENVWNRLGYILLGVSVVTTLLLIVNPPISATGQGYDALAKSLPRTDFFSLFEIFLWIFISMISLFWLVIDMVDRRSRFIWAIPQTICGLCGVAWFPLAVYFWIGRE